MRFTLIIISILIISNSLWSADSLIVKDSAKALIIKPTLLNHSQNKLKHKYKSSNNLFNHNTVCKNNIPEIIDSSKANGSSSRKSIKTLTPNNKTKNPEHKLRSKKETDVVQKYFSGLDSYNSIVVNECCVSNQYYPGEPYNPTLNIKCIQKPIYHNYLSDLFNETREKRQCSGWIKPPKSQDIMNNFRKIYPRLRWLYNKHLKASGIIFEGTLIANISISPNGRAIKVTIDSTTINNTDFENSIIKEIKKWKWNNIERGITTFTIPLEFYLHLEDSL